MSGIPAEELKKIQDLADKQMEIEMQPSYKQRLGLETKATSVIKENLEKRKKLNLHNGNDWKVKFLQDKLDRNTAIIGKLRKLIKK